MKTILLASFCGFATGNCVGLGVFSGGAVRYRLCTAAGVSPGQIARVILFISIAFGVGLGAIAALGLILHAREAGGLLGASPEPLRTGAATALALAIGFTVLCALRRTPWRRGPIEIVAPDTALVLTQLLFTLVDVLAAAATLRACGKWPRDCRAAENCDELAPSHCLPQGSGTGRRAEISTLKGARVG